MAHECPNCGITCHCNGDIDDLCLNEPKYVWSCCHCDEDEIDYDEQDLCDECGGCYGTHAQDCPNTPYGEYLKNGYD